MTPDDPEERFEHAVRRLFARRPERMLPGLERITALCASLGQPQLRLPAVHLTGTNGKTTLVRMVAALLAAHGRVPGAYTSPHLQDVRERIHIGGRPISRSAFVEGLEALGEHVEAVEAARGEMVTFFETLTGLAFASFASADADCAVVEVGMGGRWDATNVLEAEVAVVNPVRIDHAELGETVEQVAQEKAGIIGSGATCVSAAQLPSAARVIAAEARARGATLATAGRDFGLRARRAHPRGQRLALAGLGSSVDGVELGLHGAHQADNAAVALAATEALLGSVDAEAVRAGFAAVRSPGRLEVLGGAGAQPPIVLDGAHNPAGAQALATALEQELAHPRRVVVLGAMGDKDCGGIVDALVGVADRFVCSEAPTFRSAPAEHLAKLVRLAGGRAEVEADVRAALARARELAEPDAAVVVTGSLYLVGAARDALGLRVG